MYFLFLFFNQQTLRKSNKIVKKLTETVHPLRFYKNTKKILNPDFHSRNVEIILKFWEYVGLWKIFKVGVFVQFNSPKKLRIFPLKKFQEYSYKGKIGVQYFFNSLNFSRKIIFIDERDHLVVNF